MFGRSKNKPKPKPIIDTPVEAIFGTDSDAIKLEILERSIIDRHKKDIEYQKAYNSAPNNQKEWRRNELFSGRKLLKEKLTEFSTKKFAYEERTGEKYIMNKDILPVLAYWKNQQVIAELSSNLCSKTAALLCDISTELQPLVKNAPDRLGKLLLTSFTAERKNYILTKYYCIDKPFGLKDMFAYIADIILEESINPETYSADIFADKTIEKKILTTLLRDFSPLIGTLKKCETLIKELDNIKAELVNKNLGVFKDKMHVEASKITEPHKLLFYYKLRLIAFLEGDYKLLKRVNEPIYHLNADITRTSIEKEIERLTPKQELTQETEKNDILSDPIQPKKHTLESATKLLDTYLVLDKLEIMMKDDAEKDYTEEDKESPHDTIDVVKPKPESKKVEKKAFITRLKKKKKTIKSSDKDLIIAYINKKPKLKEKFVKAQIRPIDLANEIARKVFDKPSKAGSLRTYLYEIKKVL